MKTGIVPSQAVLVVEGHPLLKWLTVDLVADAGFEAVQASNADEALAILEGRSDILLLLTSIRMPGSMDGLRLAHSVHDRWPSIKIIVASGWVRCPDHHLPPGSRFFAKPYQAAAMIAEISSLIGTAIRAHEIADRIHL